jgi:hypothetical protein
MVPDSSPRASKGVLILAWRLFSHFCARGTSLSRLRFVLVGGGRPPPPPPGVAPEASEEWFDSFEVLMPCVKLRLVWSFPHANWP